MPTPEHASDLAAGEIHWLDNALTLRGGEQFLVRRQTLADPPELWLGTRYHRDSIRLRPLLRTVDLEPSWAQRAHGTVDTVSWPSGDAGRFRIRGLLLLPPHPERGQPHPLLVYNRGGPATVVSQFEDAFPIPVQAMAAAGYVVLIPNTRNRLYPGDTTEGLQVHAAERSDVIHEFRDDILAGIGLLVRRGLVDSTRMGIAGFSYGGGLTAYAVTHSDRFRAAEIGEPSTHLETAFARWGDKAGRAEAREWMGIDGNIYDSTYRRAVLEPQEAIFHVGDVRTPILTECGPLAAAAQPRCEWWFQGLRYMGVPSEFVVYPRSGHGWFEPTIVLDSFERNQAWFDYWLLDKPYRDSTRQAGYDRWKAQHVAARDPRWAPTGATDEP